MAASEAESLDLILPSSRIDKITAKALEKAALAKAQVDDTGNSGLPRMLVRMMR